MDLNSNSNKETQDFMNVESFSQLPFIRPAAAANNKPDKPIRLFGIDFNNNNNDDYEKNNNNNNNKTASSCEDDVSTNNNSNSGGESGRRFECHYCCRNFPTSQALGGHQNAHKRERQHAKRAHLHSAMAHHSDYLLNNYQQRLSTATTSYPSWNNHSHSSRFYGGGPHHYSSSSSSSFPINGNPLALWRIPAVQSPPNPTFNRDRPSAYGALPRDHVVMINGGAGSSQQANNNVHQDNVSLDLHL